MRRLHPTWLPLARNLRTETRELRKALQLRRVLIAILFSLFSSHGYVDNGFPKATFTHSVVMAALISSRHGIKRCWNPPEYQVALRRTDGCRARLRSQLT